MLNAQVAIAQEETDEALAILDDLPESSALRSQALLLAGQLELRRDRLRIAEEYFLRAIERDPNLTQAYRELIFIYGFRSQSEAIEEIFTQLARLGPLSPKEAFVWSLIRGVQWTPEEIVETLSRAVQADPDDTRSRIALADALLELTRFEEAETVLAPLDLSDPDSRAALGRLALERGDVPTLRTLLAEAPRDHPGIALLRGKLALQTRDLDAAVASYRAALELRPNDRDALSGLAQALNQSGKRDEATAVTGQLTQVNRLNNLLNTLPTYDGSPDADRYVELGQVCEAIGFTPQARAWYQSAIQVDPFHREAQQALARLGDGPPESQGIGSDAGD
ncbi:tetratricopeptide repeat protein [Tautonia sp. JC769]|uniref:tetratricopeptide repeat protein n=1 Tax=Tautonia sp. JC769 TaxID=3232135 RepID=UPI0034593B70